jgi:putative transcriptional regulator
MTEATFKSFSNQFLIAMPELQDPNFSRTVTLICQHDENGALGVIINRTVNALNINDVLDQFSLPKPESEHIGRQPVYVGGPVHTELGLVLHRGLGNWQSTIEVGDQVGLTSSRDVLEAIANSGGPDDCLLVLGYAGWGAGQLDFEIRQNAWLTVSADPRIIFEVEVEQRWTESAASLGIDITMLSMGAGHA